MKRKLIILLAFVMLLSLCACGKPAASGGSNEPASGQSTSAPDPSAPGTADPTDAPESDAPAGVLPLVDEPATLTMVIPVWDGMYGYVEDLATSSFFSELEKITGVHIEMHEIVQSEAGAQYGIVFAGGQLPDLLADGPNYYAGGGAKGVDDGIFMDLTELLPEYAPDYMALVETTPGVKTSVSTKDGLYFGVYSLLDQPDPANIGPFIRSDWLKELNMDIPETYDDWTRTLTAFKTEKDAAAALDLLGAEAGTPCYNWIAAGFDTDLDLHFFNGNWGNFFVIDGTVHYGYLEEGARDYFTQMHQWYVDGLLHKEFYDGSRSDDERAEQYSMGNSGIFFVDFMTRDTIMEKGTGLKDDYDIEGIPDPVREKGDEIHLGKCESYIGNGVTAISADSENYELAVRWLNFLYTEEGSRLCSYGAEGVAYNMDGDEMVYTDVITKGNYSMAVAFMFYGSKLVPAGLTHYDRNLVGLDEKTVDALSVWAGSRDGDWKIPQTMVWDPEKYTEYSNIMADINTYCKENALAFITGDKDLSEFDAYIDTLNSIRIDEAIALVQKTYDENYK